MSFIHIKRQTTTNNGQAQERFAVQAMAIQSPEGKKLIPNPSGKEAAVFNTLEEAVEAVKRAGFDYIFEGQKVFLNHTTSVARPKRSLSQDVFTDLQDAVPILIERLQDKEPSVVGQAAFALGQLEDTSAIEPLVTILGHEDPTVRRHVADSLARLGLETLKPLQTAYELAQNSKDKNAAHIRLTVMHAFTEMVQRQYVLPEHVTSQAIDALEDTSWLVRAAAAQLIGLIASRLNEDE